MSSPGSTLNPDLPIAREGGAWGFVPDEANQALHDRIFGQAGNGAPLGDLFDGFGDEAGFNAKVVLTNALATGSNPLAVTNMLAQTLGTSQARAHTIARTELLGAYRDAQLDNYRANSDVLRGWMWSAAPGCCAVCMFMDGSVHDLDEDMDSHVNCRCSPIPITQSWDDILGPLGIDASDIPDTAIDLSYEPMQDWFVNQASIDEQIAMLGPAKWQAWMQGDITLGDLVGVRDDGAWGRSIYERSLRELGLNARDYLRVELPELPAEPPAEARLQIGSVSDMKAREAELERFYEGMPIGDPTTLEAADPEVAKRGQDMLDSVLDRLATRLENDQKFMRFARYMGYDNSLAPTYVGDAAWQSPTLAEARHEMLKQTIYDIFEEFHSIPEGTELFVQSPLQIAMQEAVRAEFGLADATGYWPQEGIAQAQEIWGSYRNGMRAFFRAMYDETQAWFADQGITEVQLFRGLRWTADAVPEGVTFDGQVVASMVDQAPMTSWSSNAEVALDYARDVGGIARPATAEADYGMVMVTRVPVEQVIGTPFSGFGTPPLRELIVLGVPDDALALPFAMDEAPTLEGIYDAFADSPAELGPRGFGSELASELPDVPGTVTRSGTYPDGREWTTRRYPGTMPAPPDTEQNAMAGLGRDDGARWKPEWQRVATADGEGQWADMAPRYADLGQANQQCLNCDRIFGGPLEGEYPDHVVSGSHGYCQQCWETQVRHDYLARGFSRNFPDATPEEIEQKVAAFTAMTPEEQQQYFQDILARAARDDEELPSALPSEAAQAFEQRVASTLGQDTASDWTEALGEHGQISGPIAERPEALAWTPMADSSDVSQALSDQLNTHVNLDELHPAAANQFAQVAQVLQADFPEVFDQSLDYIGTSGRDWSERFPDSTLGRSRTRMAVRAVAPDGSQGIGFNRFFWSAEKTDLADLTALLQDQVEAGWFYDGYGSPGATLAHEFGHSLEWWAVTNDNPEVVRLVEEFGARWESAQTSISAYAASSPREAFAEAFSALHFGSPDVLADPMVQDMARLLQDIRAAVDAGATSTGEPGAAAGARAAAELPSALPADIPVTPEQFAQADLQPFDAGGSNTTYTFSVDGVDYFAKTAPQRVAAADIAETEAYFTQQLAAESAVQSFGQALGVDDYLMPSVQMVHDDGLLYQVSRLEDARSFSALQGNEITAALERIPVADREKLSLMEYVTGDYDRHPGNYLLTADGRVKVIDFGLAFRQAATFDADYGSMIVAYGSDSTGAIGRDSIRLVLSHAQDLRAAAEAYIRAGQLNQADATLAREYLERRLRVLERLARLRNPTMIDWARIADEEAARPLP
jgi:hypothetical protein